MTALLNWARWCWKMKCLLPWSVNLVSHRELTEEEYNYPSKRLDCQNCGKITIVHDMYSPDSCSEECHEELIKKFPGYPGKLE